jgi:hypothetical protein
VPLDDSLRHVERAVAAGDDTRLDVWMGMPHGFAGSVGTLKASAQALDAIGTFLVERRQARTWPLTAKRGHGGSRGKLDSPRRQDLPAKVVKTTASKEKTWLAPRAAY